MIRLQEERLHPDMLLIGILPLLLKFRDINDEKEPGNAPSLLKPQKTNLNLEASSNFKATKTVLEDDFLDSIDISELEKDLQ